MASKKRSLGKHLQNGTDDLASIPKPVSEEHNYDQRIQGNEIQWWNQTGEQSILFFYIVDPRNIEQVSTIFRQAQESHCELACIFVHQWTDGEGNWDVFGLRQQRGLIHWNRFWGKRSLENDQGPFLRDDIYSLFSTGQDFPKPGRKKWAQLLETSANETIAQLGILADEHQCTQQLSNSIVQWRNPHDKIEALFFIHKNFPALTDYIHVYTQIHLSRCPVTFLFQKAEPGIYDIFRLSARSYLEHQNQAK
ncbi:hypothetical protein JW960_05515 [candidate division KSB1 bacterium]|nr:hypothetical protein [candidate division KSB1 bacterium]